MNEFTQVIAYYDNPGMLEEQLRIWRELPEKIRTKLHVRIIDDGSPNYPARGQCEGIRAGNYWYADGLASFELWEMQVDVRWNQDACRNWGVQQSKTPWVLLTDIDHVVPAATWDRLMFGQLDQNFAYSFGRVNAPKLDRYKPHPNTWALTRALYWYAGGYDEALAGNYGTDGDFKVRLNRVAPLVPLDLDVIRYSREVIPDASTTTLERKSERDKQNVTKLVKMRANDPKWRPLHFSFPCLRVL